MNTNNLLNYQLYIQRESGFERTSFHSEFEKYHAIQSGDVATVKSNFKQIRANFNSGKGILSQDPVRNIRYHMIISTALTARICVEGGMNHSESYTLSDIYIQKADLCTGYDELMDLFEAMQIDFAIRMQGIKKEAVVSMHVRKCIDYIYEHMHEKLTISVLAEYTGLNPSYLSRLFIQETGCSIHKYITTVRIDTAKNMILYSDYSYLSIAMTLGFSSQSAFIHTFRKLTGCTPLQFKNQYYDQDL